MDFTDTQKAAMLKGNLWFNSIARDQYFIIAGYAGCLDKDTLILTNKGTITMEELILTSREDLSFRGFKDYNGNLEVYNGKKFTKVSNIFATDITEGYRIRTKSGLEIKCSDIHPVLVSSGSERGWVRSKNLKVGNKIATLNGVNGNNNLVLIKTYYEKGLELTNVNDIIVDELSSFNRKYSFIQGLIDNSSLMSWDRRINEFIFKDLSLMSYFSILLREFGIVTYENDNRLSISPESQDQLDMLLDQQYTLNLGNNNDYYFDEVVEIEPITQKFYDITVPEGSSFISNSILSHNTGKSTIVDYMIKDMGLNKNEVMFATFTGKAALELNKKNVPARTIHKLVYNTYAFYDPKTRKQVFKFEKKDSLDYPDLKLIVIDEFYMVPNKLLKDLESFNIKIIALGDPGQLAWV